MSDSTIAPTGTTLTLHDIVTSTPLQLSTRCSDSLRAALSSVPAGTMQVGLTVTDQDGGEIGLALAARMGDHWTVGAAIDKRLEGPLEVQFQASYRF
jgi:hypothetical protein